jgi:23S rRNA pseudouridine955/2504/2580 synthase
MMLQRPEDMSKIMEKQDLTENSARQTVRHITVDEDDAGTRLDKFLIRQYPGAPRTRLFRIVRKGEVRLNGKRAAVDSRLSLGDVVRLPPLRDKPEEAGLSQAPGEAAVSGDPSASQREPATTRQRRLPAALLQRVSAAVLHEDERLLVVNKPAGIAVHGGSGVSFGIIEALRAVRPNESLELVHRLDRDTSGVLLISRKPAILRMLHANLRDGEGFEKRYLALLKGQWQLGKKRLDLPLRTDLRSGGERTVRVREDGKESVSDFRPIQFFGRMASLMEVSILTGRTHQIRVHAAYAGHPVAGDDKYGDREFNEIMRDYRLERMFLHASSISFTWPDKGTPFSVNAPLPEDLAQVIDQLSDAARKSRAGRRRAR